MCGAAPAVVSSNAHLAQSRQEAERLAGSLVCWRRRPWLSRWQLALLGGAAGCWAGMYLFRHKTRHWYFAAGMPLILACQVALAVWLCR